MTNPLILLPTPRNLKFSEGACDASTAITSVIDPQSMPRQQSYRLTIAPRFIRIVASDLAGMFYAEMTLRQIKRQSGESIPCLEMEDWPDFANRGVMLDISRDKVPTIQTLFELIDSLAEWKINQFQLYTEHTFAYSNHRKVWEHASPITADEIRQLDAYCKARFIELVPNQNSFGHMERWLKHEPYRALAETTEPWTSPWGEVRSDPTTLDPSDPGSVKLIDEMFAELLPNFSSKQFNVGCDETFELGQGKSKAICEQRGKVRVYLDFLLKIRELAAKHDRQMMFWGDIILHHPELIPELPKDVIALEWGYEADHPFDADCEKFAKAGVPFYVCPGTSSWNTIAGRTDNAIANLRSAADNGLKHGAIGYLITDWGDNGHWQHLPISWLGFAYGAAMSWCGETNCALDIARALDLHVFEDSAGVMGKLLYDLGNAYQLPGISTPNASPFAHILQGRKHTTAQLDPEKIRAARDQITAIVKRMIDANIQRVDADQIEAEIENARDLLLAACDVFTNSPARERLRGVIEEYKRLWLLRNRPGGLIDSVARLEKWA
jgi:hexosaminidase